MNIMNFVLTKLNEDHPYFFGADIYMRIGNRKMEYAIIDPDYLSVVEEERIPVGEINTMETPFVEKNGKTDYTVIYACLLKMPKRDGEPFDKSSDAYQALLAFKGKVNGKRFVINNQEYSFKATHFHARGEVYPINDADYRMLEMQLTYTVLESGKIINSDTCPISMKMADDEDIDDNWHAIDYIELSTPMGTETHTRADVRTNDRATDKVMRYVMSFTLIFNYQGGYLEEALYAAQMGVNAQITQKYNLKIEHPDQTFNYLVQPIAGSPTFRANTTDKVAIDMKEVDADVE